MELRVLRLAFGLALLALCLQLSAFGQTSTISGVINIYTPVLSQGPCANVITVASSAGFNVGDTVLIIQMQGATIDQTNTASFGNISSYNSAGLFEKAEILSISGGTVYFTQDLIYTYNFTGKVQMISVPVYQNANVSGTVSASPWNGTTGGVVVLEVRGTLNVTAGEFNTSVQGFRGGAQSETCPNSCNFSQSNSDYFYADPNYRSAYKGEGIAAIALGMERGRGSQANGGGGGNDHNSGGGAGSNLVAGGQGASNAEPGTFLCKGFFPGLGGKALSTSSNTRLYMGGGGGSGHGNNALVNGTGCTGGGGSGFGSNGGGIIIVMANTLNASGNAFRSNSTFAANGNADGGGGGGAGGTILLDVTTITASPFVVEAKGGNGGATFGFGQNRCYGPGGGGAGGALLIRGAGLPGNVTATLTGGIAGVILSTTNACLNTSGNALAGGNGPVIPSWPSVPIGTVNANVPCILPVEYGNFSAKPYVQNTVSLDWTTTSEVSNVRFDIEHSTNGIDFQQIGMVASKAVNGDGAVYNFIHRSPIIGDNWYRLQQFDQNGNHSASEIKYVRFEATGLMYQNLYPNPVEAPKEVIFAFVVPKSVNGTITLMNTMGQVVYQTTTVLNEGPNALNIPTQGLSQGMYFLKLSTSKYGELVQKLKVN